MQVSSDMEVAASMIVTAVGKARYDVTRYPAHVALVTDDDCREELGEVLKVFSRKWWFVLGQYMMGVAATFLIPFCVLHYKTPDECGIIETVDAYFRVHQQQKDEEEIMDMCVVGLKKSIWLASAATGAGFVYNCGVAFILRISLLCTNKIYNLYVSFVLSVFDIALSYTEPVVFNTMKPMACDLNVVWGVLKRLSYPVYMISYAFVSVCWVLVMHAGMDVAFSGVLVIFMIQTYLPIMAKIGAASPTLIQVVTSELKHRALPTVRKTWKPFLHLPGSELSGETDVLWRLFRLDGDVFTCSTRELGLLIRYFEVSQEGVDGQCWMYDWHDRLCIAGNTTISTVYVVDLNLLLTRSGFPVPSKPPHEAAKLLGGSEEAREEGTRSEQVCQIVEAFLADCRGRLQTLMDQCN